MHLQPKSKSEYYIFLASPSDVQNEREIVRNFFERYNKHTAHIWNVRFEIVDWENYSTIGVGRPQQLITKQTLERYSQSLVLVIGIMAQRFGSPTGKAESGTEEEFNWAFESNRKTSYPEIKWFFKDLKKLEYPILFNEIKNTTEQWEKVTKFKKKMQSLDDPVFYNLYCDENEFREILEKDLNHWFSDSERPWVKKFKELKEVRKNEGLLDSDMDLLVEKHAIDICTIHDDKLSICEYHSDRFDIRLFEQTTCQHEIDIEDNKVVLRPDPELYEFFEQMQMKTEVAGHWGLMKTHRDWLLGQLYHSVSNKLSRDKSRINIMQAGIAGHVHYFANIRILNEALKKLQFFNSKDRCIEFSTFDICLGPLELIKYFLKNSDTVLKNKPHYLDYLGQHIRLHPSFFELLSSSNNTSERIKHLFYQKDLLNTSNFLDVNMKFDIVMAHQLFTFWRVNEEQSIKMFCRNIREWITNDTDLLIGFSSGFDEKRLSISNYEKIFIDEGFDILDKKMTWDIYDLDYEVRRKFLAEKKAITLEKSFVLLWLKLKS